MRIVQTPSSSVNFIGKIIFKATMYLLRDFGEINQMQHTRKGSQDFALHTKRRLESFLFRELEDYYPVIQFTQDLNLENIKEESFWVVDVLNGFDNFMHGIAHEATVILLYEDRSLSSAVIYDTLRDELFWSAPQLGAHLNQTRLRVSTRTEIQKSLLGIDFPKIKTEQLLSVQKFFQFVLQQNIAFRTTGAPFLDLAYMAAGRFDGLVMFDPGVIKCQVAELFSTESGGFSDKNYARYKIFCSGNEMIYKKLSENAKLI